MNENVQTHSQKVYLVCVCVCVCVWLWSELTVRVPLSFEVEDFWIREDGSGGMFDKRLFYPQHSFRSQFKQKRRRYGTRTQHENLDFKHAIIYGFEVMYMLLSNSRKLLNKSAGFEKFFELDQTTSRP